MWDVAASSHLGNNLDHPMGPFLYGISCMHCMSVSLAQGGDGLGAVWGEEKATAMLEAAGLTLQGVHRLPRGPRERLLHLDQTEGGDWTVARLVGRGRGR